MPVPTLRRAVSSRTRAAASLPTGGISRGLVGAVCLMPAAPARAAGLHTRKRPAICTLASTMAPLAAGEAIKTAIYGPVLCWSWWAKKPIPR